MLIPGTIRRSVVAVLFAGVFGLGSVAPLRAVEFSTVVIDAGHGGNDQGTMWGGVKESMLTLQVAERLEVELQKRGLKTAMTRRSDVFTALCDRPEIANRYPRSIFVSIHFNSYPGPSRRGVETYYGRPESLPLARAIQGRMAARLKTENRGVKQRLDFRVLRVTNSPAVLLECGFISNPIERRLAVSDVYQNALVQAISDGIMAEHQQPPGIFSRTYHALLGWARDRVDELEGDLRPWL